MNSYGERMLEMDAPDENLQKRFQRYVSACKRTKIYEYALPYLMALVFYHKREGWKKMVDGYLNEMRYLDDSEKQQLLERLTPVEPPPEGFQTLRQERENTLMNAVCQEYASQIKAACAPNAKEKKSRRHVEA